MIVKSSPVNKRGYISKAMIAQRKEKKMNHLFCENELRQTIEESRNVFTDSQIKGCYVINQTFHGLNGFTYRNRKVCCKDMFQVFAIKAMIEEKKKGNI